jgi:hypothetical protein
VLKFVNFRFRLSTPSRRLSIVINIKVRKYETYKIRPSQATDWGFATKIN